MRILITKKEAIKLFKRKVRRRMKKAEKIPGYIEYIKKCADELDVILAFGNEKIGAE